MGLGLGLGVAAMAQMRSGQEAQPTNLPSNHGAAGFGGQGYPNPGGDAGQQGVSFCRR